MNVKQKKPRKVSGRAWCGRYRGRGDFGPDVPSTQATGDLGWVMPFYVSHGRGEPLTEEQQMVLGLIPNSPNRRFAPGDMYRVRITVEPVLNKRGLLIVRRYKNRTKKRGSGK